MMLAVVKFIANVAIWLYLGLAIIGLVLLRKIQLLTRERSQSIFDLERERATAGINRNLFFLLVVFLLGGGVYYTANELIKEVPLPEETPTPTPIVRLPDTPTPPPLLPTPTPTLTPTPRPTSIAETLDTPSPSVEPQLGTAPDCPLPGAHITRPGDGATVSGVVQVTGAASIDNFDYYKIEFRAPGGEWHFIESHETPAGEGPIASWNTATIPPGGYEFRLVVVDITGNFPEPCQIRLNVSP